MSTRLSGLEVYTRILTVCETLAILENWRNQSPTANTPLFRWIVRVFASHFEFDQKLTALLPREPLFTTSIETRSQSNPHCFRDTHTRLLAAREALLPWLLMATYVDHPPTAVEAYRFLKLDDIQKLLEKITSVLKHGATYIDRGDHYGRFSYINDQKDQLNFLLDLLPEYGLQAESYSEAVQEYIKLLDSIFPSSAHTAAPSGNVVAMVSSVPDTAGL
jgi:hypothetical protein